MTNMDITNATASTSFTKTSTPSADTDGQNDSGETEYVNDQWTTLWGYFMNNAELKA